MVKSSKCISLIYIISAGLLIALYIIFKYQSNDVFSINGDINDLLLKHRLNSNEKNLIENILAKSNLDEKLNKLYPDSKSISLTEPVKIFILKEENFLKKLNFFRKFSKYITEDYKIIQGIKDDKGDIVGSAVFRKGKGVSELKDLDSIKDQAIKDELIKTSKELENKWYLSTLGGGFSIRGTELLVNWDTIKDKITQAGGKDIKNISLVSSNIYLPSMIYFQIDKNGEYVIPVDIGIREEGFAVGYIYNLKDIVAQRKKYFEDLEYARENNLSTESIIPIKIQPVTAIDIAESKTVVYNLNVIIVTLFLTLLLILLIILAHKLSSGKQKSS